MAIGINLNDNDDIGPLSHWNDEEFDFQRVEDLFSKESILKSFNKLSERDKQWIMKQLEKQDIIRKNLKKK